MQMLHAGRIGSEQGGGGQRVHAVGVSMQLCKLDSNVVASVPGKMTTGPLPPACPPRLR